MCCQLYYKQQSSIVISRVTFEKLKNKSNSCFPGAYNIVSIDKYFRCRQTLFSVTTDALNEVLFSEITWSYAFGSLSAFLWI